MYLFITVFLTLYGGMQWYWYRQAASVIPQSIIARLAVSVFLLFMVAAPVAVRLLERHGYEAAARWTALVGYSWMGFLFLCCCCFLLLDLLRLLLLVWGRLVPGTPPGEFLGGGSLSFGAVTLLVAVITVYGWFEARAIRTESVDIYSTKIPKGAGTVTVAQISDVHLGLLVGEDRLKAMLAALREAQPDLLVATGDLVDDQLDGRDGVIRLLREYRPPLGKFAVTGNHERYAGGEQALEFLRDSGFTLLRGESAEIAGLMTVAGVDDLAFGGKGESAAQERRLLSSTTPERFLLLLKHRPVIRGESRGRFDLQLSGHVHQGQIYPFTLLTRMAFPIPTGLSAVEEGGAVYVSRGTGTWGPPMRFLAPPEVTIFRLRHP